MNKSKYHNILGSEYYKFRKVTVASTIEKDNSSVHCAFRRYPYPVSSWPIIIDEVMVNQIEILSTVIPKLLKKIPDFFFKNEIKEIADFYYGGNKMLADLAMISHNKDVLFACRLDLILSDDRFKVLEANIGSSLGGWQIQSFEKIIRLLHPELNKKSQFFQYYSRDTLSAYMLFLLEQMRTIFNDTDNLNLFIDLNDVDDSENYLLFFNEFYQKALRKMGLTGNLYTGQSNSLQLYNNCLYLNNQKIHGVILSKRKNMTLSIFRAFLAGKLYTQDHLGLDMLGDKRNLWILRELAQQGKFSYNENVLILDCIPWTTTFEYKKIFYKNKIFNLIDLLQKNKDNFVIKASSGSQGNDVFVGKYTSDVEWFQIIEKCLKSRSYIAQEFCASMFFNAPNNFNKWVSHSLIWGAFGFGDTYGGVWVRMKESSTDDGVINSAKGAVEAIVFEKLGNK